MSFFSQHTLAVIKLHGRKAETVNRVRKRASWWHLGALIGLSMVVGGAVGYVFTGIYLDPLNEQIQQDVTRRWQAQRTRKFLLSVGVDTAKKGFFVGSVFGAFSMITFLVKARLTEPKNSSSESPRKRQ